jgi:hypothetical protein
LHATLLGGSFLTIVYGLRAADFDSNFLENNANRATRQQTLGAEGIQEWSARCRRSIHRAQARFDIHIRSAIDRDTGRNSTSESRGTRADVARPIRRAEAYASMLTWISDAFVLAGENRRNLVTRFR